MNYSINESVYNSTKFMSFNEDIPQQQKLKSKKSIQSAMGRDYNRANHQNTAFFSFEEPKT